MFKNILLTAVLTFALSASTAWAQGCDSGCTGCGVGQATGGYGGSIGSGCDSGGCGAVTGGTIGGGCDSGGGGCDGGGCAVGQNYFAGDGGCGTACGPCRFTRIFGGINFIENLNEQNTVADFEEGWGAGLALGRRNGNRRVEVEFSFRDNSLESFGDTGTIRQVSNMYNVLFDLDFIRINNTQFYTGGGVGLTYADAESDTLGASVFDTAFSYQAITGFSRQLRTGSKAFVEYRYLASEFDFGGVDVDIDNHSLFLGFEMNR